MQGSRGCSHAGSDKLLNRPAFAQNAFLGSKKAFQRTRRESRSQRFRSVAVRAERGPRWEVVWQYLVVEKGFESTAVEETKKKVDSGDFVFIDVRPRARHEDGTIPGAISVPLYQKVDFSTFGFAKYLRALALLVNGVEPVELNPNFMEQLIAAAGGKGIVIFDEIGGQLEPTSTFGSGKTSRSLLAVYQAIQSGKFKNVVHMRGGIYSWYKKGLPIDGNYDGAFAGRTPSVVEEKEFSYGRPPTLLEPDEEMGGSSAKK